MWNLFGKKKKEGEHRTLQLITDKNMPFGYVEAYKSLRTNLDFMAGSMDVHTLVLTSTVPEESKSNVAVNLSLTMAESGKKVALVDCDLRKPVLHRYLKAGHNVKGVSNVLSNQCTLDEALHELKDMNMTFLPAGTPPPNPSEMLSQPQMQTMVNHLQVSDPGQTEGNPVFMYLDAFCCDEHFARYLPDYANLDELKAHYRRGGLGDVKVKKFLNNVLQETLEPIRTRRKELEKDPGYVMDVLRQGTEVAQAAAAETLAKVKHAMKIDYFA